MCIPKKDDSEDLITPYNIGLTGGTRGRDLDQILTEQRLDEIGR